jgi:hypothetical protein
MHMTIEDQRTPPSDWLIRARLGWVLISLLAPALFVAGIPARLQHLSQIADQRSLNMLRMNADTYGILAVSLDLAFILGHYLIALVIFLRRDREWMCLLVALSLVANGSMIPLALTYNQPLADPIGLALVRVVIYIGLVSSILLLYLFPDGRFVPRWTRYLAILWALICLPAIFAPHWKISVSSWPLPLQVLIYLAFSGSGVFAQIYRYQNVSSLIQRQQAKWGAVGLAAASLGPFGYFLPFVVLPNMGEHFVPNMLFQRMGASFFSISYIVRLVDSAGFNLFTLIFPLSFAIAILRYRLWDIDILINRALVYTSLSGALLALYLTSVVVLEGILRPITGEGSNQLVTVISTLTIAASFAPLRRRVQSAIDRRFYRSRYNAARTLEAFSAGLRDEVDLNTLSGRLVSVVDETMQPENVVLWIKPLREEKRWTNIQL